MLEPLIEDVFKYEELAARAKDKSSGKIYAEAVDCLASLVLSKEVDICILSTRAYARLDLDRVEEAFRDYDQAINLALAAPTTATEEKAACYYNRSRAFIGLGKLGEALNDINQALELSKDCAEDYKLRAEINWRKGNLEESLNDCEKALDIDPNCSEAYNIKGLVLDESGKSEDAILLFKKALELSESNGPICSNLALTLLDLERPAEAIPYFKMAVDYGASKAIVYNGWGCALKRLEDLPEARHKFINATGLDSSLPGPYINLGGIYKKESEPEKAKAAYQRALDLVNHQTNKNEVSYALGILAEKGLLSLGVELVPVYEKEALEKKVLTKKEISKILKL